MSFTKKMLIPDYLYSARVNVDDISFFEDAFYQEIEFYEEEVKNNPDKFSYAKRMGYIYLNTVKERILKLPSRYTIKTLGDDKFQWKFIPEIIHECYNKVAICAGAGTNVSFELQFADMFPDMKLILLDPSPHSIKYIDSLKLPNNMSFLTYGLSDEDKVVPFYKPDTPGVGSLSILKLHPSQEHYLLPVKKLSNILKENSFNIEDLCYLKFDIEGEEHNVINNIIQSKLRPAHIAFEFDQPVPPWTMEKTLKKLISYQYGIIDIWGLNILSIDLNRILD